jgi:hypothetical protein
VRGTPPEIQVVFCRRRHQPTSPPLAKLPPLEKNYGHSYPGPPHLPPLPPFSGFNFFSSVETRLRNSFMTL